VTSEVKSLEVVAGPNDDPAAVARMKRLADGIVGTQMKAQMDDRGFVKNSTVATAEGLSPELQPFMAQLKQLQDQVSYGLPAEAVGRGARWQVDRHLDVGGIVTHSRSVVTLVGRNDQRLIIDVGVQQSADPQEIKTVGLSPDGSSGYVESLTGTGHGRGTMSLTSLVGTVRSTVDSNASMLMVRPDPRTKEQQRVRMIMKTKIETSIAPES
jgi:hypothetical protein